MGAMFFDCNSLNSLNLRNFNSSNVFDIGMMFMRNSSLTSLNVSSFDTSNVTNMGGMFESCSSLTSLNISNFNTSKVKDMTGMFDSMWKIKVLDLSNFDTSSLERVSGQGVFASNSSSYTSGNYDIFGEMRELTTIYVGSKWNISKVQTSDTVFVDSKKIRGGNGTTYNSSHIGTDYMHIDGVGGPGYLTKK
jgi:surface protein